MPKPRVLYFPLYYIELLFEPFINLSLNFVTGRRRSRSGLLRFYAVVSSIVMLLLIASLATQHLLLKVNMSVFDRRFYKKNFINYQERNMAAKK